LLIVIRIGVVIPVIDVWLAFIFPITVQSHVQHVHVLLGLIVLELMFYHGIVMHVQADFHALEDPALPYPLTSLLDARQFRTVIIVTVVPACNASLAMLPWATLVKPASVMKINFATVGVYPRANACLAHQGMHVLGMLLYQQSVFQPTVYDAR
jgi:hypothetical protein